MILSTILSAGKLLLGKYAAAKAIGLAGGLAAVTSVIGVEATGELFALATKPTPQPLRRVTANVLDLISKAGGGGNVKVFKFADIVMKSLEEAASGKKRPSKGLVVDVQSLFGKYVKVV